MYTVHKESKVKDLHTLDLDGVCIIMLAFDMLVIFGIMGFSTCWEIFVMMASINFYYIILYRNLLLYNIIIKFNLILKINLGNS